MSFNKRIYKPRHEIRLGGNFDDTLSATSLSANNKNIQWTPLPKTSTLFYFTFTFIIRKGGNQSADTLVQVQ